MDYFSTSILTTGYASLKNRIGLCACVNSRLNSLILQKSQQKIQVNIVRIFSKSNTKAKLKDQQILFHINESLPRTNKLLIMFKFQESSGKKFFLPCITEKDY